MNEQRQQAYLNLISALLTCPGREEAQVLSSVDPDLINMELVEVMEQVAAAYVEQGEQNTAYFLTTVARKIAEAFHETFLIQQRTVLNWLPQTDVKQDLEAITSEDLQAHAEFLERVLQATVESEGNSEVIYPLLSANTDKLDLTLAEILQRWATLKLAEVDADTAQDIAIVIIDFGNLIAQFPLGDQAKNREIAITSYEISSTVYTRHAFPQIWAITQANLAIAYSGRIQGDRAKNIEKAIAICNAVLTVITCDAFPEEWAGIQRALGIAYFQGIDLNKAENIENAIVAYNAALTVYTRDTFPQDWAMLYNNLALAYNARIKGNKAENIEKAIAAYNATLTVSTRNASPQYWATTQSNLGTAYRNRIYGDKTENIEKAIAAYNAALTFYTRDTFPQDWAMLYNNLGSAYDARIRGNKAENIEKAIAAYNAALTVYTRNDSPQNWATTQNNLGTAYLHRVQGDKAENIENSIAAYNAVLSVHSRDNFLQDWAEMQNNLGAAYRERILGNKAENIENAIIAYNKALTVYSRDAFPYEWAKTQLNLGLVYRDRVKGNKADNIEQAIAAYHNALNFYTCDTFPVEWAKTQNNLGAAYFDKLQGDKTENLENTINAYNAALTVYTRDAFPQDWAGTQNNLGYVYSNRKQGDKVENTENARAVYKKALTIYTRVDFPQNHAQTSYNLGFLYQREKQFGLAYDRFLEAIETAEALREEIVSEEESKRKQAEEWNQLYRKMVEVCVELGKITEAIEYVERSKTRNLVELILTRDLKTIFSPEVATQLETLKDEIAIGQKLLQIGKAENQKTLTLHLQQLRQQRNELQDKYLPIGYSFQFDRFQATLDEHTTIIEWYITFAGLETFIITRKSLQRLPLNGKFAENLQALTDWANEYLRGYFNNRTEWEKTLASRLSRLAEILDLNGILKLVPENCTCLVLIPHRYLHLFPLHAMPLTNGNFLCDIFPKGVGYAPSCQILQQVQQRQYSNFLSIFAIQNPTEDLDYTNLEVNSILPLFSSYQVLPKKQATKAALSQAKAELAQVNHLHFSCHGSFNVNSPVDSCLLLAGANENGIDLKKCLTLSDLFDRAFDLNQCRLVTLSACETGLIDFNNSSDEYIGLPSGFLYAGSQSVVSSLWTVNDLSTAFLMIQFYQNLQMEFSVAVALNRAQCWLRNITGAELSQWIQQEQLPLSATQKIFFKRIPANSKPFQNPFHWAAFCAIGQ